MDRWLVSVYSQMRWTNGGAYSIPRQGLTLSPRWTDCWCQFIAKLGGTGRRSFFPPDHATWEDSEDDVIPRLGGMNKWCDDFIPGPGESDTNEPQVLKRLFPQKFV